MLKVIIVLFSLIGILELSNAQTTPAEQAYIGEENILINPGAENGRQGWTIGGTGTFSLETASPLQGKQSFKFVTSSQTLSLIQDSTKYQAQFSSGTNCEAIFRAQSNSTVAPIACARQAGVTSTTDCITLATDNSNALYSIPFVCRGTSNGISITANSATGTTLIDSVYVGPIKNLATAAQVGPWQTGTCTSSHTSNASTTCRYRVNGDSIDVQYRVAYTGSTTAANLTFTIPSGFTLNTSKTNASQIVQGNSYIFDTGVQAYSGIVSIDSTSTVRVFVNRDNVNTNPSYINTLSVSNTVPWNGSATSNGDYVEANLYGIPVNELNGNVTTYSQPCGANCVNEFSAFVNAGGGISSENVDWLSSCSYAASSMTCTVNTGVFTARPSCTVSPVDNDTTIRYSSASTATSLGIVTEDATTNGFVDRGFFISCQKSTADYQASRSIVGSFKALDSVLVRATVSSGTQNFPTATTQTIIYDNEIEDTKGWYNPATGVFTVGAGGAGFYFANCQAYSTWGFDINEQSRLILYIADNPFYDYYRYPSTITGQDTRSQSAIYYMNVGETIYCTYFQASGTTQALPASSANQLTIVKIPGQLP